MQETGFGGSSNLDPVQEIIELERALWDALRDEDVDTTIALTLDPVILVGPEGHGLLDHLLVEDMLRSSLDKIERYQLHEGPRVQFPARDVAVISYGLTQEVTLGVGGETVLLESIETSTWVRRRGRWQIALHTDTISGDPYGRDRLGVAR